MALTPRLPYPGQTVLDPKTGKMVPVWWRFFHAIVERTGGVGSITIIFLSDVGTVVQAFDVVLDDLSALGVVEDNEIIVGTATGVYAHESGATARESLGLVIGTDVQADLDVPSQAEAEAGTATTERVWTAERIGEAIAALETGGGGGSGTGAFPFSGALVKPSVDLTTQDFSTAAAIAFDAETYDVGAWHDNSTNNTRLTVPTGVNRVRIAGNAHLNDIDANSHWLLKILKNGALVPGLSRTHVDVNTTGPALSVVSAVVEVVAGDFFELLIDTVDNSVTVEADDTYFAIEAVETSESGQTATVQTTDATQTVLASGAMAADSAHTIRATVQGREDATGDTYHAQILGGARNEGGTSSAATPNVIEVADAGAAGWDATVVANDSTDVWEIKVTGEAAHTIDWTVTFFEIIQP